MIPFYQPYLSGHEVEAVATAVAYEYFGPGETAEKVSEVLRAFTNDQYHVILTVSGTVALGLAAKALGLKRGARIIIPAFGPPAIPNGFASCGFTPALCDVLPDEGTLDPIEVERLLRTGSIKAVCYVNVAGRMSPDRAAQIQQSCKQHQVPLIEDAAAGILSIAGGTKFIGDAAIVSFGPVKPITSGQGGAVFLKDYKAYEWLRAYVDQADPDRTFLPRFIGTNMRMCDPLAALMFAQLGDLNNRRKTLQSQIYSLRNIGFSIFGLEDLYPPAQNIVFGSDKYLQHLRESGLDARRQYKLFADSKPYRCPLEFPGAKRWVEEAIYLPFGLGQDTGEIAKAMEAKGAA